MARKPGRPPLDPADSSVNVCVRLPSRRFDALYREAQRERMTMPELIRRVLRARERQDEEIDKKT